MGSISDLKVMSDAVKLLEQFGVVVETEIISAHRTPEKMVNYATSAHQRGLRVIIAGAGGAAHLPGMVASCTTLPVIGVPVKSSNSIDGWDSILSILQMPNGVPVATIALNASLNAALLAIQILATSNIELHQKLVKYKEELKNKVDKMSFELKSALKNGI